MKTVNDVSRMTGVSIRTLHHYDAIGLLKPTQITDAGYRLYDEETIEKLFLILLFKEIGFPLKEIQISSPPRISIETRCWNTRSSFCKTK